MSHPDLAALRKRSLLILPGTQSKHIQIENQSVIDFRTFMTGELFEVLGRHSILRASVDLDDCGPVTPVLFRIRSHRISGESPLCN